MGNKYSEFANTNETAITTSRSFKGKDNLTLSPFKRLKQHIQWDPNYVFESLDLNGRK